MSRSARTTAAPGAAAPGAAAALRAARTNGSADRLAFELEITSAFVDAVAAAVVLRLGVEHQQQHQDEWLDVPAAAAYLSCNRQRLYNLASAGRIPHEHEGKRLLFQRAELDAWVRNGGAR